MRHCFLIFLLLIPIYLYCQDNDKYTLNDTLSGRVDIFDAEKPLSFTLKSNFQKFRKEKYKDKYQMARLMYKLNDGTNINRNVRIKARGEFRKQHCFFPPIRLNWRKNDTISQNIPGFYKIKMVTHCKNSKRYKQYILKEYLCYKLYNILSPKSFKVRLLDVHYFDTGRKKNNEQQVFAYFIEDIDMLAERNNAFVVNVKSLNQNHLIDSNMMKVALFQFMIGNTDWSIPGQHNVKLIKSKVFEVKRVFAVPYDFDYCGMVNASYAISDKERLGTESVTERSFLGLCKPKTEYRNVIDEFLLHKDEFYDEINSFEYLDDKLKKEMISYLDEFFQMIDNERFYSNYIKSTCKER